MKTFLHLISYSYSVGEMRVCNFRPPEKPEPHIRPSQLLDETLQDIDKNQESKKATEEARKKIDDLLDLVSETTDLTEKRAIDDVKTTEKLLGRIDPSLVEEGADGVKAYESLLGLTRADKEAAKSDEEYAKVVSFAIRQLQWELNIKDDGKFGKDTLSALINKGTHSKSDTLAEKAYGRLLAFSKDDPNQLLAKTNSRPREKAKASIATAGLKGAPEKAKLSKEDIHIISILGESAKEDAVDMSSGEKYGQLYTRHGSKDGVGGVWISSSSGYKKFFTEGQIDAALNRKPAATASFKGKPEGTPEKKGYEYMEIAGILRRRFNIDEIGMDLSKEAAALAAGGKIKVEKAGRPTLYVKWDHKKEGYNVWEEGTDESKAEFYAKRHIIT